MFEELAKPLFKRFGDPSEQCRELSVKVATHCLSTVLNLTPHLAYFFPALMRRMPQGHMYDPEMSIFIHDIDAHEAHKRGRANVRQDKAEFAPGKNRCRNHADLCPLLNSSQLGSLRHGEVEVARGDVKLTT